MLSLDNFRVQQCCDTHPIPKTVSYKAISFHSSTGRIPSQADLRSISTLVWPKVAGCGQPSIECAILYRHPRGRRASFIRIKWCSWCLIQRLTTGP